MNKSIIIGLSILTLILFSGCSNDADIAAYNLAQSADNFEIQRRVVFFNGITDKYLLSVEGLCSINADTYDNQLEVTCKTGPGVYKKHFLGLSDNVAYFVEQLESQEVSAYHYRVTFKPQEILPDIDLRVDVEDLPKGQN
jgi:hypothetical protein